MRRSQAAFHGSSSSGSRGTLTITIKASPATENFRLNGDKSLPRVVHLVYARGYSNRHAGNRKGEEPKVPLCPSPKQGRPIHSPLKRRGLSGPRSVNFDYCIKVSIRSSPKS
jgi:hypothetical protein